MFILRLHAYIVLILIFLLPQGYHGIDKEVFLSLPAVLGRNGVTKIIQQNLTDEERTALQHSANILEEIKTDLNI